MCKKHPSPFEQHLQGMLTVLRAGSTDLWARDRACIVFPWPSCATKTLQGVPTTRAASVVTSEDRVVRDLLYTGHPVRERCSVVSRIAPSFLRFGSFEIFKPVDPMTGPHSRLQSGRVLFECPESFASSS